MGNRFNRQQRQGPFSRKSEPDENADSGNRPTEDPRVRAFIRDYAPIVNQEDPEAVNFTQPELRQLFNAYMSANGFDPMIKILNQLEDHGFSLQARLYKNEFVLPVKRTMLISGESLRRLAMPENN